MRLLACLPLVFALCAASSPTMASSPLPEMGTAASATLSPSDERELGRQMMVELRRQLPLVQDAEVVDYVRDLGQRLVTQSDMPNLKFEFFVVDHPAINAFAMPGGYIGVNAGLILNARNESELAAVLAHEIAHVTQRHIARRIAASERTSLRTMALMLAGLLLGSQDPQAGSAVASAGMAGSIQQQLNFSRAFEQEADYLGIRMLAAAELDPQGMPAFFDRLLQASRYYDRPPEYLSTHPASESRIAETAARADQYATQKLFESAGFALMKQKLAVLNARDPDSLIVGLKKQLQAATPAEAAALKFGLALALTAERDLAPARKLLDELIDTRGEHPSYLLARARLEQRAGRTTASLERFEEAMTLYPGHLPARLQYAEALLQANQPSKAYHTLTRSLPSSEPQVYWLLARAASAAKLGAEPQLAMAEFYYLQDDIKSALIQLDQALTSGRATDHESARAAARKEELKRELARISANS